MEIYWLGHGCFRLRGRDATLVTDPCAPSSGYKIGKVAADIVTVSQDSPETNFRQAISGDPKFLDSPGEYEISNVLITAVETDRGARAQSERNMAFMVDLDDIRVCHLGGLSQVPSSEGAEILGSPDILLLPVGGGPVLDAEEAAEAVSVLRPKLVIPMLYQTNIADADLDSVEKFFKEMSVEAKPAEARINVTRSNVPEDLALAVLNYRGQ